MSYLVASGLRKLYGDKVAVDSIDLAVEEGEIFGLLGPNGAGKTTIIGMICGIITATAGEVTIAGARLSREPARVKRSLGYVPQELALYEELTARENLRFFASPYGISGAELDARVAWALDVAGLAERGREPVKRFSGGMKRRLNLVAGLLHRPRLLVLDEPTVGVDPQSRFFLFEAIERLRVEEGMTVVYTSHYMEEVEALCNRVAIVDRGRVIACDSVAALLAGAGTAVRIEFEGPAAPVQAALAHGDIPLEPVVTIGVGALQVGMEQCAAVLARLQAAGVGIRALDSRRADLESVFLELTGHHLRDADE